jgi:hypothetical protein
MAMTDGLTLVHTIHMLRAEWPDHRQALHQSSPQSGALLGQLPIQRSVVPIALEVHPSQPLRLRSSDPNA